MGWGTTVKTKIRLYGISSEGDMKSRSLFITERVDKLWKELELLVTASPKGLVTNYTVDNLYGDLMKTRTTLSNKVEEIFAEIKNLSLEDMKISLVTDDINNIKKYKIEKFGGNRIARFFKELSHNLGNKPTYGIERVCFVYFSKPRTQLNTIGDIESFAEEHEDYMNIGMQNIKDLVLLEPSDLIHNCDDGADCPTNMSEAVRSLRNDFSAEKESMLEDLYKWAMAKTVTEDDEMASEFLQKVLEAKKVEHKWEDEKAQCLNDAKKEFGISPSMFPNPDVWKKVDKRFEELLSERHIPEKSPVKWHEIYECQEDDWI